MAAEAEAVTEMDLMTTPQVARLFGKSQLTILNWRRRRGLPTILIKGDLSHATRYDRKAVLAWAKKHKVPTTTDDS